MASMVVCAVQIIYRVQQCCIDRARSRILQSYVGQKIAKGADGGKALFPSQIYLMNPIDYLLHTCMTLF